MKILKSEVDESVNFVSPADDGGFYECRYVRRSPEYFICYLSSHSGCNRGCKMCHLTTTKQIMMKPASANDYWEQADLVLAHYRTQPKATYVHFNWMARGEALCNETILESADLLFSGLIDDAYDLIPRFNISTIMPRTYDGKLDHTFRWRSPNLYYSLYSLNPEFREKWLPSAMDPYKALRLLTDYQQSTNKIINIHHALIKGQNDSPKDIDDIGMLMDSMGLVAKLNIVKYNAPDNEYEEAVDIEDYLEVARAYFNDVKVVERIGKDVFASCGVFVS